MEVWEQIIGYEGLYEISSIWRVKSLKFWKDIIMKPSKRKWWYSHINLFINWISKPLYIHRLVAIHFIENPDNLPVVCHRIETIDDKWMLDNGMDNLFWWTVKDNAIDCHRKWRWYYPNLWKFWINNKKSKPVYQYTKELEFIREWACIWDVERELWIHRTWISHCCYWNNKTSWWFIWKFK